MKPTKFVGSDGLFSVIFSTLAAHWLQTDFWASKKCGIDHDNVEK